MNQYPCYFAVFFANKSKFGLLLIIILFSAPDIANYWVFTFNLFKYSTPFGDVISFCGILD